jgi:hypothetical protein
MRILAAFVLVGATLSTGCSTMCGSGCKSCTSGKCSALTSPKETQTIAAKPKSPARPVSDVRTVNHEEVSREPIPSARPAAPPMSADHETMMPEGEPSASLVPPPPAGVGLGEEESQLPSPAEIAKRSADFSAMPRVPQRDDQWNESPADEALPTPAKPTQWSSRTNPRVPLGN